MAAAFYIEEHILYKGHYKLSIAMEVYEEICAEGPINSSFTILPSRLMGMEHHIFLQYIRQEYSADLHGKVGKYITYSFKNKKDLERLVNELNKRWNVFRFIKNGKPKILT